MATANFLNKNASRIFALDNDQIEDLWFNGFDVDNCTYHSHGVVYNPENGQAINFSVGVEAVMQYGYYIGGNLDWKLSFDIDGSGEADADELPSTDMILYMMERNSCAVSDETHPDVMQLLADMISREMRLGFDEVSQAIESEFRVIGCTPLRCVGRFSNGEAIYEKE